MLGGDIQLSYRMRRTVAVLIVAFTIAGLAAYGSYLDSHEPKRPEQLAATISAPNQASSPALDALDRLEVKGRAPKTGYKRSQFGSGWAESDGCDTRNRILRRDLVLVVVNAKDDCTVTSGVLNDPYTATIINFRRGNATSSKVQIDHIVALSNAWQTGAQMLTVGKREKFANDPLNLLAVDGPTNVKKGDSDAASWLPPNKAYRCRYIARQVAVKSKYLLWMTQAEYDAAKQVLGGCPGQLLPVVK